jgi:hypothetical protein
MTPRARRIGDVEVARPQTAHINAYRNDWEVAMAKGQMRSSKEKKKPKAEWNKKKKGGPVPTPSGQTQPLTLGQKKS